MMGWLSEVAEHRSSDSLDSSEKSVGCVYIKDYVIVVESGEHETEGKAVKKTVKNVENNSSIRNGNGIALGYRLALVSDAIIARKCSECEINRKTALNKNHKENQEASAGP